MKPAVYFILFLLILPIQASLVRPVTVAGIAPDLALAAVYIIGLLAGPREAALAGLAVGLLQDAGSASFLGLTAVSRGVAGIFAGLLGRKVLNIASMSNILFLMAVSLLEDIAIAIFLSSVYGSVPFFTMLVYRMLPQALLTGVVGALVLRFLSRGRRVEMLLRRGIEREVL
jgi:rod shape-determining protein MreD